MRATSLKKYTLTEHGLACVNDITSCPVRKDWYAIQHIDKFLSQVFTLEEYRRSLGWTNKRMIKRIVGLRKGGYIKDVPHN